MTVSIKFFIPNEPLSEVEFQEKGSQTTNTQTLPSDLLASLIKILHDLGVVLHLCSNQVQGEATITAKQKAVIDQNINALYQRNLQEPNNNGFFTPSAPESRVKQYLLTKHCIWLQEQL